MDFVKLESIGKQLFERYPLLKRLLKRAYQVLSVVTSKEKNKSEGTLERISPGDGYEYFCGYYDKSPWDAEDRYIIALKVKQSYKSVAPKEIATVCIIDTKNKNKTYELAQTRAWNVQQGCMAQWLGPDFKRCIIYNDFRGGKYCSVIYNVENKCEERILPLPVYDVAKDGSYALSLDFSRLHRLRPGYGYSNLPDTTRNELCPDKTCIWKIDLHSGEVQKILKYTDFTAFEHDESMDGAEHKVNHLMISPSGDRFMVLHRWFKNGRKHTRLVTMNSDGTDMYNLSDDVFVSHCFWKNDREILAFLRKKSTGDHYYLMKDKSQEYKLFWSELNTDGHCSYSPDKKYIITDTYPNRKRLAAVYLCREDSDHPQKLAQVFSPFRYDNEVRCDLHPRWNRHGNRICIDSVHEGKRGIYLINVSDENNRKECNHYIEDIGNERVNSIAKKIIHDIIPYSYVSFDIFDTLVKRDVPDPHTIFALMESMIENEVGVRIDSFCSKRIEAEKRARDKYRNEEITIQCIYESSKDDLIIKYAHELIQLEKRLEYEASCPNYLIKPVFDWCISNKRNIVLISDMYLDERFVISLLDKNGYKGYMRIFLSSTWKKRKADNGALFRVACSELNIHPKELVHIGDSRKSDGEMPRKVGCKSILIPREIKRNKFFKQAVAFHETEMQYLILNSFCQNRSLLRSGYFYSFGYEAFGPLLAGYSQWLYSEIKKEDIRHLYFFSRDGLIIKEAFDELYSSECPIYTHYLRVSRRSLRVPQIWQHSEYLDVIKGFPEASMQSIITFFDTLGLSFKDYADVCSRLGIDENYTYKKKEMSVNKKLIALYNEIKADIINNSKKEFSSLRQYLGKEITNKKVAVIDIGWRGTMQKFLTSICNSLNMDVTLFGYYIGLSHGAHKYFEESPLQFKGYLFDCNANPQEEELHSPFVGLFETLFLAQEGSVKRYYMDDDKSVGVEFYDNEYVTDEGKLTLDAQKVSLIQTGALQFVRDYKGSILSEMVLKPEIVFRNIHEVGMHPSKVDLDQFGDMEFRDGAILKLAAPKSVTSYCKDPKRLVHDFYNSRWKIGFLNRFFKLPLPYDILYKILKKFS